HLGRKVLALALAPIGSIAAKKIESGVLPAFTCHIGQGLQQPVRQGAAPQSARPRLSRSGGAETANITLRRIRGTQEIAGPSLRWRRFAKPGRRIDRRDLGGGAL